MGRRSRTYGVTVALGMAALTVSGVAEAKYPDHCKPMLNPANAPDQAHPHLALVIGNQKYGKLPALGTPRDDADAVSNALASLGFRVELCTDLKRLEIDEAVTDYRDDMVTTNVKDGVSFFYYAGHGAIKDHQSKVFGIDYDPKTTPNDRGVDIESDIISPLDPNAGAQALLSASVFVLDACRSALNRGPGEVGPEDGLPAITAPAGSYVVYSTAPNHPAADYFNPPDAPLGSKPHSPFAAQLLIGLQRDADLEVDLFFRHVRSLVREATGNSQIPWTSHSLVGDVYFKK